MRCSRGAHEALTCVIVEGEEVVEEPVDGGKSESKLEEDVRGPPRGTDARPCSREASTTAHPCTEACAVDPFQDCAIEGQRAGQHAVRAAARGTRRRGIMLREGGALAVADFACGWEWKGWDLGRVLAQGWQQRWRMGRQGGSKG